jgi:hypothetical protein
MVDPYLLDSFLLKYDAKGYQLVGLSLNPAEELGWLLVLSYIYIAAMAHEVLVSQD